MSKKWSPLTREETDRQYNPTLWTQRLPTDDLLPAHVDLTTKLSEDYRSKVGDQLRTIPFGSDEHSGTIDVFRTANVNENAPIVVYIHGGWWQWFSKEQFSYIAEPFNRKGLAVHMPGYRMAQDWQNAKPMESILEQLELALAATLSEAIEKDAPAVYLIGHSAGGQLVSMLRHMKPEKHGLPKDAMTKLKGVFSLAGLFDIRYLLDSFVNDEIAMMLESATAVSPQLLASTDGSNLCPIHLILPEHDTAEFFRQTKEYQQKLLEEGQRCHLKILGNRDHLDMIERLVDEDDELFNYMMQHIQSTSADEVLLDAAKHASQIWKEAFNAGDALGCSQQYEANAIIRAQPFGVFQGTQEIKAFWQKIIDDGFAEVEYIEPHYEIVDETSVVLKSHWKMNKASGIIHRELWVIQEDGTAKLRQDHFEVMGD